MEPLDRMKKIHLWIGVTAKDELEYDEYFNQDDAICQFCKDINIDEYDEDFIGIIPLSEEYIDIIEILDEVPIDETEFDKVAQKCKELGIEKANAVFYLTDAEVEISEPFKDNYNDLKYIGMFESSLV